MRVSIVDTFNSIVEKKYSDVAVEHNEKSIRYGELREKAYSVANYLIQEMNVSINNIIAVRNAMVGVSNAIDILAAESSKVASNYREIQNSNGAGLEQFSALNAEAKSTIGEYSDDRDTIDIKPDVTTGMNKINTAKTEIDAFITRTKEACNRIMENWSEGDANRENAKQAIDEFLAKADQYKEVLNQASTSADTAIKNYNM